MPAATERSAWVVAVALAASAAVVLAPATVALATLALPTVATAQGADAGDSPRLEQAGLHFSVFRQEGRGVQSQASPDASQRGSEDAWIFQPMLQFTVRQDQNAVHNITIPIDVVTAASPDGLDAITTASRENEAVGMHVVSNVRDNSHTSYQLHIGAHFEEYWGSGSLGGAIIETFADDNATFRLGVELISDSFDGILYTGVDPGPVVNRFTSSFNMSVSQLLSPTTIASASYSFTAQFGHLETTYNSVPLEGGGRTGDRFPRSRGRHTLSGQIRQAILETQTYLALSYRFYADSFLAMAHTAQLTATQLIGDLWLRAHYRFHAQESPSFWMAVAPIDIPDWAPRTADSDLADLYSQELAINARWFFEREGALLWNSSFLQLGYLYYWRSNSLASHVGTVEVGFGY